MSLDVYLTKVMPTEVYSGNITHNLGKMADQVKLDGDETLYDVLWRPDECNPPYVKAQELIKPLKQGLIELLLNSTKYKEYNPENDWGSYDGLCTFVQKYIVACEENPDAEIGVCR